MINKIKRTTKYKIIRLKRKKFNSLLDKEARRSFLILLVAISLIFLVAKEIHKSKLEDQEFKIVSGYLYSILENPKHQKEIELQSGSISISALPTIDSKGYQYSIKGIGRFKYCKESMTAIFDGVHRFNTNSMIRLSDGDLYPALISKDWAKNDIDNFSEMACDIVARNKSDVLLDVYY